MTDQTIPADVTPEDMEHARSYVRDFLDAMYANDRTLAVARVLDALLPAPPLPTLADMTPEERAACQWMQCDVEDREGRAVILLPNATGGIAILTDRGGSVIYEDHAYITPRPDLPRMTWPGEQESVPPNTLAVGSVWIGVDALTRACEESGRDQIVVSDFGGYVSVWSHDAEWWEGSTPPRTTPYTIIHTGKEADQ